jgi:hypothetical protein
MRFLLPGVSSTYTPHLSRSLVGAVKEFGKGLVSFFEIQGIVLNFLGFFYSMTQDRMVNLGCLIALKLNGISIPEIATPLTQFLNLL